MDMEKYKKRLKILSIFLLIWSCYALPKSYFTYRDFIEGLEIVGYEGDINVFVTAQQSHIVQYTIGILCGIIGWVISKNHMNWRVLFWISNIIFVFFLIRDIFVLEISLSTILICGSYLLYSFFAWKIGHPENEVLEEKNKK